MSTIKVDTVRPVTTDASLTLQGDSSGSGVTGITIDSSGVADFPNGFTAEKGIFNFQKTNGTVGSQSIPADGTELTIFGSHSHTFKTTDAILVVECHASFTFTTSSNPAANEERVTVGMRTSADSYASNLTALTSNLLTPGTANQSMSTPVIYRYIGTPTRSAGDIHTFKMYKISHTYVTYLFTNFRSATALNWISYEVGV